MRTTMLSLLGVALLTATAVAEVAGTYDVKYEEVATNCNSPLKYPTGTLEVKVKGTTVTVDIERTPVMQGSIAKNGKISAKSRSGHTPVGGMDGVFSVAGRITPEGMLTFMMIGEYTAGGKSLCTQSWNVVGARSDTQKSAAKSSARAKSSKRTASQALGPDTTDEDDAPLQLVVLPSILQ
jgi:hypothetical protein